MQDKKLSGDALFDSLKDGDKIPEKAFSKMLGSTDVSAEIGALVFQKLGKDGITQDAFVNYVVEFYKVTKTIAFTDTLSIADCKTLRKASIGEVVELLEGPVKDESSGITRIRAKACSSPPCEGWVTL